MNKCTFLSSQLWMIPSPDMSWPPENKENIIILISMEQQGRVCFRTWKERRQGASTFCAFNKKDDDNDQTLFTFEMIVIIDNTNTTQEHHSSSLFVRFDQQHIHQIDPLQIQTVQHRAVGVTQMYAAFKFANVEMLFWFQDQTTIRDVLDKLAHFFPPFDPLQTPKSTYMNEINTCHLPKNIQKVVEKVLPPHLHDRFHHLCQQHGIRDTLSSTNVCNVWSDFLYAVAMVLRIYICINICLI